MFYVFVLNRLYTFFNYSIADSRHTPIPAIAIFSYTFIKTVEKTVVTFYAAIYFLN